MTGASQLRPTLLSTILEPDSEISVDLLVADEEALAEATVLILVDILVYINDRPSSGPGSFHELGVKAVDRTRHWEARHRRPAGDGSCSASDFVALITLNAVLLQ